MSGSLRTVAGALALVFAPMLFCSPLGARVGPTIPELVETADVEALAASPDGSRVAFRVQRPSIAADSHRIEWFVAELATGKVRRVADGGAPIYTNGLIEAEPPVWSPDSRSFYRRAMVRGAIGIWRTRVDGSGSRQIVGGPANVEEMVAGSNGRRLSYVTGPRRVAIEEAEKKEYDDGILIDASVDASQTLYRGGWEQGRLASERLTGRWYSRAGLLWRLPRVRHQLDTSSGREVGSETVPVPAPDALTQSFTLPPVERRSSWGALATVTGEGVQQHLGARLPGGGNATCVSNPCSGRLGGIAWRPSSNELLFASRDDHYRQTLYLWDVRSGAVRRVGGGSGQYSGGRSSGLPCAITNAFVICVQASAVSAPRLVRLRIESGREDVLFDPNVLSRRHDAPAVEQLTYSLADGRTATATLLYRPGRTPARAPLFVSYYFCDGYLRGGTGDAFPLEPMVDSGFVVACLNIVPFDHWGDGPDHERAALASVSSLVQLLDRRRWIDPGHVGMGGFSAGSEATMWVAMNSKLLGAAAIVSDQYAPSAYWMSAMRGSRIPQEIKEFQQAGPPDQDPERWKLIAPALNTDRIKAPLLMQMSEQEFRDEMELFSKLSNTTTPVEMYAFPDEPHLKFQPRHQLAIYQRNLDWFRYWLQGCVDPDPARAAEFARWGALRRRQAGSAE